MAEKKKSAADLQLEAFEARRIELQKTLNKDVFLIAVPLDDKATKLTACYISKPERPVVSNCITLQSQGQILEASELLIRSSWIEGDNNILDDDDLFYSAHSTVQGIIKFRLGVLKKN